MFASLALLNPLPSMAGQCSLKLSEDGAWTLDSGRGKSFEMERIQDETKFREILQVCNETLRAISCKKDTLPEDEVVRQPIDLGKYVSLNLGRDQVKLLVHPIPERLAGLVSEQEWKDNAGTYGSMKACENKRSQIAHDIAKAAHDEIKHLERIESERRRIQQIDKVEKTYWHPRY